MQVSVKEASVYLGCSEQYVRRLISDNKLNGTRIGSCWSLSWQEVLNFSVGNNPTQVKDSRRVSPNDQKSPIKCLSFFSGAMGLDIGLEKHGIETLLACEIDKSSRKTISFNKPDIALIGDIENYSSADILKAAKVSKHEVDLIVGGPPCQAFSSAGKRKGFNDVRGNVFLTFVDRVLEILPKFLVIENVRGILSAPLNHVPHKLRGQFYGQSADEVPGSALLHIIRRLRRAGYGVSFNLYNSANFGSPQKRERVVIVCSRDGVELPYLNPSHSDQSEFGLAKWKSLRTALYGLDNIEHEYVNFPEKRLRFYRLLREGQNWKNLSDALQKEALGKSYYSGGGKTGFLRRLAWDKPSPTLVTHPAMPATDLCHPESLRPLSVQEYKRIQEFPDEWLIAGGKIDKYKQIGNAVPVSLGMAIGKLISNAYHDKPITNPPIGFRFSRYKHTAHLEWEKKVLEKLNLVKHQQKIAQAS